MPTYLVQLPDPLAGELADELAKRVYYLAPGISGFSLLTEGGRVTGVEIATEADVDRDSLARGLADVVRTEIAPQRTPMAAPIWTSPHQAPEASGIFEELRTLGAVHVMGPGAVATGPIFTEVLDALDTVVRDLAVHRFGATPYRYPALISTEALAKGGYLSSFPQFVLSASRLCSDFAVYRRFVNDSAVGGDPEQLFDRDSTHSGYCLPPTVCFHTYLQLSGQRLRGDPIVVTSRGKSFRFESRYSHTLERLWDFTIREIVFLGASRTVARCREDFLDAACALIDELGVAARVTSANDPFFADASASRRALAQRLRGLKYELRLPAEDGRTVAAASFNLHGTTFGEPYAIVLPTGETAHSACVGFGLERLAFALFCQHGVHRRAWPDRVRAALKI